MNASLKLIQATTGATPAICEEVHGRLTDTERDQVAALAEEWQRPPIGDRLRLILAAAADRQKANPETEN